MESNPDGIESPPYPDLTSTAATVYRHLHVLRQWVIVRINEAQHWATEEQIEKMKYPDELPGEAVWGIISLYDQFQAMSFARRVRESWDAILRDHELRFESDTCRERRFYLIMMCLRILEEAFVDPETREARNATALRKEQKRWEMLSDALDDIVRERQKDNLDTSYDDDEPEDDHPPGDNW